MAWYKDGDWDGSATPPGIDRGEISIILSEMCAAFNNRAVLLGEAETTFPYQYVGGPEMARPTPSDFDFTFSTDNGSGRSVIGWLTEFYLADITVLGGGDAFGHYFWFTDATCTTLYTPADIRTDALAAYPGHLTDPPELHAPNWMIIKDIFDRCVFAKIAGVATDLRPLLPDQT